MKDSFRKAIKFSTGIAVVTLVLAAIFSVISTFIMNYTGVAIGMLVVLTIVLIGIIFDIIGVAATAANEVPLHAMASEKVPGARQAVLITRNADKVSSFSHDVIGDVTGIISGIATGTVVLQLTLNLGHGEGSLFQSIVSVVFTSVVAALTVGGKALCKSFAIRHASGIVIQVGKILHFVENKMKLSFTSKTRRNLKGK